MLGFCDQSLCANVVDRISFLTDELNQFSIGIDALIQLDGPWLRVRLGIVDSDLDFQVAVVRPSKPLCDFGCRSHRAATNVQPDVVDAARWLHDQRISFPLPDRVAVPPRLRILPRQGPPVGEYLTQAAVRLVNNKDQIRSL